MARSDPTPVNTLVLRAPPGYTWVFRYLIAPRNGSKVGVKGAYALITMRCRYKLYLTDWNSVDPATPMFSTSVENDNHGSGALPSRRSRRPAKTTESNQWVDTNPISFRAGAETIKFFNSTELPRILRSEGFDLQKLFGGDSYLPGLSILPFVAKQFSEDPSLNPYISVEHSKLTEFAETATQPAVIQEANLSNYIITQYEQVEPLSSEEDIDSFQYPDGTKLSFSRPSGDQIVDIFNNIYDNPNLVVQPSKIPEAGLGVFTTAPIKRGERITRFEGMRGDIRSMPEVMKLWPWQKSHCLTVLRGTGGCELHGLQVPRFGMGVASMINSANSPNEVNVEFDREHFIQGQSNEVWLVATRDIAKNEELYARYSLHFD